ncbi:hypothetical protein M9H77_32788 [Catharanthus roseus]|uniref:Uncharacterized protein n=1 Tax=Catharanthus roseus TaxID=4058 RepID=A0ACC0A4A9_CATRO|nr:hypothetical protein M9H77_32788 [Catharanthus roseus]
MQVVLAFNPTGPGRVYSSQPFHPFSTQQRKLSPKKESISRALLFFSNTMASSKAFLVAVAMVLAVAAPVVMAKDIMVGDENGWKLNFDYIAWAKTQEFHVGDRLVFMYKAGSHNVLKANQTEFHDCVKPLTAPLTSGNDIITLASPGKKWYICGVATHCQTGNMKLAINVLPELGAPAPAPTGGSPGSAAIGIAPSNLFSWMVAGLAIFLMIKA